MKAAQKNELAVQLLECLAMWEVTSEDAGDILRLMVDIHKENGLPADPLENTGLKPIVDEAEKSAFSGFNVLKH